MKLIPVENSISAETKDPFASHILLTLRNHSNLAFNPNKTELYIRTHYKETRSRIFSFMAFLLAVAVSAVYYTIDQAQDKEITGVVILLVSSTLGLLITCLSDRSKCILKIGIQINSVCYTFASALILRYSQILIGDKSQIAFYASHTLAMSFYGTFVMNSCCTYILLISYCYLYLLYDYLYSGISTGKEFLVYYNIAILWLFQSLYTSEYRSKASLYYKIFSSEQKTLNCLNIQYEEYLAIETSKRQNPSEVSSEKDSVLNNLSAPSQPIMRQSAHHSESGNLASRDRNLDNKRLMHHADERISKLFFEFTPSYGLIELSSKLPSVSEDTGNWANYYNAVMILLASNPSEFSEYFLIGHSDMKAIYFRISLCTEPLSERPSSISKRLEVLLVPLKESNIKSQKIASKNKGLSKVTFTSASQIKELRTTSESFSYLIKTRGMKMIREGLGANKAYRAKIEYLSKIAHEFKTPLLNMNAMLELITEEPDKREEMLQDIREISNYCVMLTHDFKFLAHQEINGGMKIANRKFKLESLIKFVYSIFSAKFRLDSKRINFMLDYRPRDCPRYLVSDELRIKQILINLLSNSQKFTLNGTIRLIVEPAVDQKGQDVVRFTVRDTGKGMTTEVIRNIMQPFNPEIDRSKENLLGAGLGLNIVYCLCEGISTEPIKIDSKPGEGTSISFNILSKISDNSSKGYIERTLEEQSQSEWENDTEPIQFKDKELKSEEDSFQFIQSGENKPRRLEKLGESDGSFDSIEGVAANRDQVVKMVRLLEQKFFKQRNSKKIVLIDDQEKLLLSHRRLIEKAFSSNGKEVEILTCTDGVECLYALWKFRYEKIHLDAIISDHFMEFISGDILMNSLSSLRSCGKINPQCLLVLLTGDDLIDLKTIDRKFPKPLSVDTVDEIYRLLNK